ncbi:MAG: hypothetical protein ACLTG4_06675 [Oscillospiraceae bacterium]
MRGATGTPHVHPRNDRTAQGSGDDSLRCQRHSFKRIPVDTIAARLNYVARQEQPNLQPDAAALLARMADGGMRDALTLLDQCSGSDVITTEAVISAMGLPATCAHARLLQSIVDGDTAKTLNNSAASGRTGDPPLCSMSWSMPNATCSCRPWRRAAAASCSPADTTAKRCARSPAPSHRRSCWQTCRAFRTRSPLWRRSPIRASRRSSV